MVKKLFVCTRPNQLEFALTAKRKIFENSKVIFVYQKKNNFLQTLKVNQSNKIIFIPKKKLKNFKFKNYNQIYFPYTIENNIFELIFYSKGINKNKIKFFYDGIGSYMFTNKKFAKDALKSINFRTDFKFSSKDFLGIKEYDLFFKRKTINKSLSLNDIYKKKIEGQKIFTNSKGIFLGQPLPRNLLTKKNYSKIILNEFRKKNIDTYVLHPLEKKINLKLNKKIKIISLKFPIENYYNLLKNKTIYGLYSSALLFFHIKGFKVKVVDTKVIDRKKFNRVYKYTNWMINLINV